MEKVYNPKQIEQPIYEQWEKNNYFKPNDQGTPYCIMLPPPNVTGSLHMGHGFQHTIMDALIRYHRMMGNNTLWQPGTDHAGIATQMVVERQLMQQGKTRLDLGREKFIEKVWEWKNQSGDMILQQMRRLGTSPEWSRTKFTLDDDLNKAVKKAFIDLYHEGLIYRGKRLVNWDPILHTAISDLEVINEEEKGSLWHIQYPLSDGSGYLTIATTRPETMLGDAAVAVHPTDERYQQLIGKQIKLPLCDREIPIIADEYVDKDFGTGCVKITPAHDFNDHAVGKRHQLPLINILTYDAKINDQAPQKYRGLDRFEARKQIVCDLEKLGLLVKTEPYLLNVPRGDRSKTIIEPWLTDQWFLKTEVLAKPAIEAVESGQIKFIPETWAKTYFQWMNHIEDWCISRQLWWGHRIPAWYDDNGNIYVGEDEKTIRDKNHLSAHISLKQENDVLDTWFSSALWPFSTLGWPEKTKTLDTFYPTSVLVTGFDIIFFWVARMIMFGLKFTGKIPFKEVYMTGLIRDSEGQKMSKSKGNILDPIDLIDGIDLDLLIEKRIHGLMQPEMKKRIEQRTKKEFPEGIKSYGTDALRFTFCSLASTGRDIRFDLGRLEGYRNFCNKIWNATRFALMQIEKNPPKKNVEKTRSIADQWILSRLQKVIKNVHEQFSNYRFDLLSQNLYEFTWYEFCDWYLELTKPILSGNDDTLKQGTIQTLIQVLETVLRLLHPLIPFITESLWQAIKNHADMDAETIMLQPFPIANEKLIDETTENDVEWIQKIILAIRNIRGEMNIHPNKTFRVLLKSENKMDGERFNKYKLFIFELAKVESFDLIEGNIPESATAVVGQLEIFIPLAGLINKDEEIARLAKEIGKLKIDLEKITTKLANANFVEKAPKNVVEAEKQRAIELKAMIDKLTTVIPRYRIRSGTGPIAGSRINLNLYTAV